MLTKKGMLSVLFALGVVALPSMAKETEKKVERRVIIKDGKVYSDSTTDEDGGLFRMPLLSRNFVGVQLTPMTPELRSHFGINTDSGVLVGKVVEDSPAARAGLKAGDIITSIDGKAVQSPRDLTRSIRDKKAGDQVKLEFVRDRVPQQAFVAVVERKMELMEGLKHPMDGDLRMAPIDGETAARLERFFKSSEWQEKLGKFHDCGELQGRLRELETRLKDLEKRLEKK